MAELEGFLCPLCKQDCRSVLELETHYREQHDESSASKLKKDFLSFFSISSSSSSRSSAPQPLPSRSLSREDPGDTPLEPVTNVSGINTDYWPCQDLGLFCLSC